METVRTMAKCIGVIGIFIVSLFIVGILYYFCININNIDNITDFGDLLAQFGQNIIPGIVSK